MSSALGSPTLERGGDVAFVAGGQPVARTPWQQFWLRFRRDRAAVVGLIMVIILGLLALFAPVIAALVGHGPNELFPSMLTSELGLPKGPSTSFFFGVDQVGRDVFIRTLYGLRTSLTVSLLASTLATVVGVALGITAGYVGGVLDTIISRLFDVFLALPVLLFAISLSSVCSVSVNGCAAGTIQPGIGLVTVILALFSWPYIGRIVRGQVISLREYEFVLAAHSLGARDSRIMFREIFPNLIAPILVFLTLIIPSNILFEAALSFFGIGIPQSTPSLGRMIADATQGSLFTYAWWMMVFPGLFLLFATFGFNLVGDGLRDATDPGGGW